MFFASFVALALASGASAPAPASVETPSIRLNSYAYKALRGKAETAVEFGLRIEARAPFALGTRPLFTAGAEVAVISQAAEPVNSPDVSLVKAVDVVLTAERRIGSVAGAETSVVGLWAFGSALPGEAPPDRTLRRYGLGVRVSHRESGASGRLVWGRDDGVGARGWGQFIFDGVVPLVSDRTLIGGLSASLDVGRKGGQDRVLVWLGTDPVALLKRIKE